MKPRSIEFTPDTADNRRLANLCGALDQNLRQIEEAFDVRIAPMSVVYSLLLTVLFAAIVDFVMYFRLRRISMAESLKSIE